MNQSESINELATALSKAQGQLEGAKKDSNNPFFKSKYADLSSVWDACRKALSDNGLSIIQSPEDSENGIAIETMLLHSSGQWIKGKYSIPVSKQDAQAVGSAISYGKRYALASIVGISPEDDDGNAAVASKPVKTTETITNDQISIIHNLIRDSNADAALFLKMFNVSFVDQISSKDYESALAALNKKIQKNKELKNVAA